MASAPLVLLALSAPLAQDPWPPVQLPLDAADARWRGALPIADGARGGAARFDGKGAHVDAGPCPVSADAPFALRCSLRTTNGSFSTPLMARDGDRVGVSLVVGREPGRISFEAWSWAAVRLVSTQRIDDGRWHTIEVGYDPATNLAALFVDDALQAFGELGEGGAPLARLRLGDNIGAHQPFAGDLDEVELLRTTARAPLLRRLGPVLPLDERAAALRRLRQQLLPRHTPSLAEAAAADWPRRAAAVRTHAADALGLLPAPARAPLDVAVHGELVRDGVRLQRLSWTGWPGQRATGWLWSPQRPAGGRRPAVLNPHGHWQDGARHPVVQARCAAFAKFGWLALAVDSVHVEHVPAGVSAIGAMTWHNQRALDLLLQRDDVDPRRIAVTGASGGGQQTYYLMALEDRLAAAAPVVMACYLAEIVHDTSAHCGCNHPPRLAAFTDVPELCAVFAPRPVFFGSVSGDWTRDFPQHGLPELRAHWARLGGDEPRSRFADEGHNYDRPSREAVYGFLQSTIGVDPLAWLKSGRPAGHPWSEWREPPVAPFAAAELQPLLSLRPDAVLDAAAMAQEHLARRPALASLAALAPGLDLRVVRRESGVWHGAAAWNARTVRGNDGVPIPLRHRPVRDLAQPFTVVLDPRGAASLLAEAPAWLDGLPNAVLVDPRPYGEWARFRAAWQRNGLLLGRGEGYQAALDTAIVCASLPGDAPVHVRGRGEAGVVALLAAHLCPRIVHVAAEGLGPDYAEAPQRLPLCPEILRWRDVPALVAGLPPGCTFATVR